MADEVISQRHRQILELTLKGWSSKQIARELAVSPHTVDTYCRELNRRFGVSGRREAAQAAADAGLLGPSQSLRYDPGPLVGGTVPRPSAASQHEPDPPNGLRDAAVDPFYRQRPGPQFDWPFPTAARPRNRMRPVVIVAWVFALTAAMAIAIGVFVIAAEGLARFLWAASS